MTPEKRTDTRSYRDLGEILRSSAKARSNDKSDEALSAERKLLDRDKWETMEDIASRGVDVTYVTAYGPIVIFKNKKDGVSGVSQPEREKPTGQK